MDIKQKVRLGIFLIVFSAALPLYPQSVGMGNPSAVYCEFLGYKYETRKAADGSEYGICKFPDGSECDAFAFFRGECGKKYSYCALKGCDILTKEEANLPYPACSCLDSSGKKHLIPLNDFMEQHGDTLFGSHPKIKGMK
jgi:putative hemolysin